jgi:hypothetical protein
LRATRGAQFPIIPCNLCGSQTNMQRVAVKNMLRDWEQKFPGRVESIFSSICNVVRLAAGGSGAVRLRGLDGRRLSSSCDAPEPSAAAPPSLIASATVVVMTL